MPPKKKVKCWTKPKKEGGTYTTCKGFQDGDKKKKKAPPTKAKAKAKPSELAKFGLTKEEANKMDPAKLFGMLPTELRKNILKPKVTGVKVGDQLRPSEMVDEINSIVRIGTPKAKFNSKNMNTLGNQFMKALFKRTKMPTKQNYHELDWARVLKNPERRETLTERMKTIKRVMTWAGRRHASGGYAGTEGKGTIHHSLPELIAFKMKLR